MHRTTENLQKTSGQDNSVSRPCSVLSLCTLGEFWFMFKFHCRSWVPVFPASLAARLKPRDLISINQVLCSRHRFGLVLINMVVYFLPIIKGSKREREGLGQCSGFGITRSWSSPQGQQLLQFSLSVGIFLDVNSETASVPIAVVTKSSKLHDLKHQTRFSRCSWCWGSISWCQEDCCPDEAPR